MFSITILFGLIFLLMITNATGSVERLLDLMTKKGIITQEEGATLRKEVREDKEQKAKTTTEQVVQAKDDSKPKVSSFSVLATQREIPVDFHKIKKRQRHEDPKL